LLFSRTAERKFNIGFDLGEKSCQISYTTMDGEDPKTFSMMPAQEQFNIPTQLTKKIGANLWYCGTEAEQHIDHGEGTLVTHIYSSAVSGKPVMIEGQEYEPCSLLALYVRRCLALLARDVPTDEIGVIMFTAEKMDRDTVNALQKVRKLLNLPVEAVYCESCRNSFYNYMLMSPESMHENDVLLCEYDGEHAMRIDRLSYNYRTSPVVAFLRSQEYPQLSAGQLPSAQIRDYLQADAARSGENADDVRDSRFLEILKQAAPEHEISSVFLIGEGFRNRWMKQSLTYIAYHRRVFLGNNLYSKGAAYGALIRRKKPEAAAKYFFLGENKLTSNIGLLVRHLGRSVYHPVLSAGENWYEVDREEEYILEEGNELTLVITPLTGGDVRQERILLDQLPKRAEGTVRIGLRFTMSAKDKLTIDAEDLGFGEIARSSGQTWNFGIQL